MGDPITEREKTLAAVLYHPYTGFGSVELTFSKAHLNHPTIETEHVRAFLAKRKIRHRRKPLKVNSFVPDFPKQELQVDLLGMGENAIPHHGLIAIDIFTEKGA